MALLYPDWWFEHITRIPVEFFEERDIRLLVLDVDNTLTTHNNPTPAPGVMEWLSRMKAAGIKLTILSNNHAERVEPFARLLGLPFVAGAAKPLPLGLKRACTQFGCTPAQTALIGDQLFTDILCGNLLPGVCSVLVTMQEPEHSWFFRQKRRLERPILRRFARQHPRQIIGETHL